MKVDLFKNKFLGFIVLITSFILLSLNLKSCNLFRETQSFGYDYHIIEPESNVYLESDTLFAIVGYSGCTFPHKFELRYKVTDGNSMVWFRKITPDEPCQVYIRQRLKHKLPLQAFGRFSMVFLGPRGVLVEIY